MRSGSSHSLLFPYIVFITKETCVDKLFFCVFSLSKPHSGLYVSVEVKRNQLTLAVKNTDGTTMKWS